MYNREQALSLAKEIFHWLYVSSDVLPIVDVVMGFGHFDLKIPRHCGQLCTNGFAQNIIFTGGSGSGSAEFSKPEALVFFDELRRVYPNIRKDTVVTEDRSTNTLENILFTRRKLASSYPNFNFHDQIKSAIIVACAYRQRRVFLTCRRILPGVSFYNAPPETSFRKEEGMFSKRGLSFFSLLVGEVERIIQYGEKGDILRETVPDELYDKYRMLKKCIEH
jgi:hypothetical protein